jgi:hypothetical protein
MVDLALADDEPLLGKRYPFLCASRATSNMRCPGG